MVLYQIGTDDVYRIMVGNPILRTNTPFT